MNKQENTADIREKYPPLIRKEHKGVQITIAFIEDAPASRHHCEYVETVLY